MTDFKPVIAKNVLPDQEKYSCSIKTLRGDFHDNNHAGN